MFQVHGILENPFFFTVVSKLALRIVLFYWYWHRLLNFWYRDTPSAGDDVHKEIMPTCFAENNHLTEKQQSV